LDTSYCVSKIDPLFGIRTNLYFYPCVDAIALGDTREIFLIDTDFTIKTYLDNFCLISKDGVMKKDNVIENIDCGDAIRGGDER